MNNLEIIKNNFLQNQEINIATVSKITPLIEKATLKIFSMIKDSGKLMSCGNGGSSGDAQHITSEFINRFETERKEMPAISLNSDTATITSIANDYDYKYIFSKQISALGTSKDLLMAFTTSGNSENIIEAINIAQKNSIGVILVTGNNGGKASKILTNNDIEICVPSNRTSRIQEMHLITIHAICECLDNHLSVTP
jgi:phosphoheptose isomerase